METSTQKDQDVERLASWARSMNLNKDQFNTISAIVEVTVQNKLKEFAEAFMKMDIIDFRKEQSDMIEEKKNKTGLWA